jgi:hypothetical protein
MSNLINERRATGLLIVVAGVLTLIAVWTVAETEGFGLRNSQAHFSGRQTRVSPPLLEPNSYFPSSGMP